MKYAYTSPDGVVLAWIDTDKQSYVLPEQGLIEVTDEQWKMSDRPCWVVGGQLIDKERLSSAHEWNGKAWVLNKTKQAELDAQAFSSAQSTALARIDAEHQAMVQALTGNPTEVERATWERKLSIAQAVASKSTLTDGQNAFIAGAGFSEADLDAWAQSVLRKAKAYSLIVGAAERVRDTGKDAVRAAKTVVEIEAAMAQLAQTANQAQAQVLAKLSAGG